MPPTHQSELPVRPTRRCSWLRTCGRYQGATRGCATSRRSPYTTWLSTVQRIQWVGCCWGIIFVVVEKYVLEQWFCSRITDLHVSNTWVSNIMAVLPYTGYVVTTFSCSRITLVLEQLVSRTISSLTILLLYWWYCNYLMLSEQERWQSTSKCLFQTEIHFDGCNTILWIWL